jgi:hypothetical protein
MSGHWGGLIELLVVLSFVMGWAVLELVTLRMDRRAHEAARQAAASAASGTAAATEPRDAAGDPDPRFRARS